jgi:hypothetical protein
MKMQIVCMCCGSENIVCDAIGQWSIEKQEWLVSRVSEAGYCRHCAAYVRYEQIGVDHPAIIELKKFATEFRGSTG